MSHSRPSLCTVLSILSQDNYSPKKLAQHLDAPSSMAGISTLEELIHITKRPTKDWALQDVTKVHRYIDIKRMTNDTSELDFIGSLSLLILHHLDHYSQNRAATPKQMQKLKQAEDSALATLHFVLDKKPGLTDIETFITLRHHNKNFRHPSSISSSLFEEEAYLFENLGQPSYRIDLEHAKEKAHHIERAQAAAREEAIKVR